MITVFYLPQLYMNFTKSVLLEELKRREHNQMRVCDLSTMEMADVIKLAAQSNLMAVDISIIGAGLTKSRPVTENNVWANWRGTDFYWEASQRLLEVSAPRLCLELSRDPHGGGLTEHETRFDALAYAYAKPPISIEALDKRYLGEELLGRFQNEQGSAIDVDWVKLRQQYPNYPESTRYIDPLVTWQRVQERYAAHIEIPHCLAKTEYLSRPAPKLWNLCVAGAPYVTRQMAKASAGAAGVALAPYRVTDFILRKSMEGLGRVVSQTWATTNLIKLRRISQEIFVKHSRLNFVCGSGLKYLVRKFFEVPAAWSPMIAYPCAAFEDYGFIDGQNVVICEPADTGQVARELLKSEMQRQKLADNAWATVARLHSAEKRATDLITCMQRLKKGQLKRAEFVNGEYEIT